MDTHCLSEKAGLTTTKDAAVITQFEELLQGVDRQKAFNNILTAKTDVSRS